jgi:dihydrolipoamide dehydrogenase
VNTLDLIVIGSGPGGYKAAITAAHLGARVALVEKGLAGGTCLNQGCIPKKALLHLAALIEDVRELQGRGLSGAIAGDFAAAMAHKDEVVGGIRDNFSVWLKRLGARLVFGQARIAEVPAAGDVEGLFRVVVTEEGGQAHLLAARRVVIATGSEPRDLPECPVDGEMVLHSPHFMFDLRQVPKRMLFVGGGAIGVELGYLMHQFGSEVVIAEASDRILGSPRIPERAGTVLERKLRRIGIDIRKQTTVKRCLTDVEGAEVLFSDGRLERFDRVLVAVGRRPRTAGLGLEALGVDLDADGFIRVSPYLESSVPGLYAVGDCKRGPMTANAALHDAKIAAGNAVGGNAVTPNYFKVPMVVHSALEIAAVGLTEDEAEQAGFEPDVARTPLAGSGKARAHHEHEGFIEVVHDAETGQLLGGCIVGPEAGEQIHMMSAACQSTRGLWFFKDMSYSHPSWCEELETTVDPYASALQRSERDIFKPGILASRA